MVKKSNISNNFKNNIMHFQTNSTKVLGKFGNIELDNEHFYNALPK